jgi:hypothetical protein
MATPTMDSIKKKMQAMKTEKENASDRAEKAEQNTRDVEEKCKLVRFSAHEALFLNFFYLSFYFHLKAEEENNALMKKINQLDNDLDKAQEQLAETNNKLEEANKKSADVSVKIVFLDSFLFKSHSHKPTKIWMFFACFFFK